MLGRPLNGRLPTLNIDNRCFQRPLPNIGINCQRTFVLCVWQRIWLFPFFVAWQLLQGKAKKELMEQKSVREFCPKWDMKTNYSSATSLINLFFFEPVCFSINSSNH